MENGKKKEKRKEIVTTIALIVGIIGIISFLLWFSALCIHLPASKYEIISLVKTDNGYTFEYLDEGVVKKETDFTTCNSFIFGADKRIKVAEKNEYIITFSEKCLCLTTETLATGNLN